MDLRTITGAVWAGAADASGVVEARVIPSPYADSEALVGNRWVLTFTDGEIDPEQQLPADIRYRFTVKPDGAPKHDHDRFEATVPAGTSDISLQSIRQNSSPPTVAGAVLAGADASVLGSAAEADGRALTANGTSGTRWGGPQLVEHGEDEVGVRLEATSEDSGSALESYDAFDNLKARIKSGAVAASRVSGYLAAGMVIAADGETISIGSGETPMVVVVGTVLSTAVTVAPSAGVTSSALDRQGVIGGAGGVLHETRRLLIVRESSAAADVSFAPGDGYTGAETLTGDDLVAEYICAANGWHRVIQPGGGGAGDFLADGSVPMTGNLDAGGNAITNVGNVDGRDVSGDGAKLDLIEDNADVTNAANVAAAGAMMKTAPESFFQSGTNPGGGQGDMYFDTAADRLKIMDLLAVGDYVPVATDVSVAAAILANVVTDHGALTGLADDDHTQYLVDAPATSARNTINLSADVTGLTIDGHTTQTEPLLRVEQDDANGGPAIQVRMAAGQTAKIFQVVDSTETETCSVTSDETGTLYVNSSTGGIFLNNLAKMSTEGLSFPEEYRGLGSGDSPYAAATSDYALGCDCALGAIEIDLPAAPREGQRYFIKKTDASANAVTIDYNLGYQIEGANTYTLSAQYDWVILIAGSNEWLVIAAGGGASDHAGTGTDSMEVGDGASASGLRSTAVGPSATASQTEATALGQNSSASGVNSTALGQGSFAGGTDTIAIGNDAKASGSSQVVIGHNNNTLSATRTVLIGSDSTCTQSSCVGVGHNVNISHAPGIALGRSAATTAANQLVAGSAQSVMNEFKVYGTAADTELEITNGNGGAARNINVGWVTLASYTDATRPAAGVVGRMIYNTDDSAPNFDDGTNWRDAAGAIT